MASSQLSPCCDVFLGGGLLPRRSSRQQVLEKQGLHVNYFESPQNGEVQKPKLSHYKIISESEDDDTIDDKGFSSPVVSKKPKLLKAKIKKTVKDDDSSDDELPSSLFKMNQLSDYEIMIQKNIEEKNALIQSLKIDEIKENLIRSVQKSAPIKRPHVKQERRSSPQRKSLRLAKINIDLSEDAIIKRAIAEAASSVPVHKEIPPVLPFSEAVEGNSSYEDFSADFCEINFSASGVKSDCTSQFSEMTMGESQLSKVVPSRISSMSMHPMEDKIIIAAGSKQGSIGLWNVNSEYPPTSFAPHSGGITRIAFNPNLPHLLISSSYDGTVRCGDLEMKVFDEIYNVSDETCCTSFDFISPDTLLVAQRDGNVSIVDYRSKNKSAGKSFRSHDCAVKCVNVHPKDKNIFLAAGVKGSLRLWDLRMIQKEPVVEVLHHSRCVHSAYFSPLTGNSILTTSADDSICLFDSCNLSGPIRLKKSLRHNNYTGRWLTVFRATWMPSSESAFVVGSLSNPRRIEVFNDQMRNIFNFSDEYLSCITSVNVFHPSRPILAGANSSGKVYVFSKKQ